MRFGSYCALAMILASVVGCSDASEDNSSDPAAASEDAESALSAGTDASDAIGFGDGLLDFKGVRDRDVDLRDRLRDRLDDVGPGDREHRLRDLFERLRGDDCGKPDVDSQRL